MVDVKCPENSSFPLAMIQRIQSLVIRSQINVQIKRPGFLATSVEEMFKATVPGAAEESAGSMLGAGDAVLIIAMSAVSVLVLVMPRIAFNHLQEIIQRMKEEI